MGDTGSIGRRGPVSLPAALAGAAAGSLTVPPFVFVHFLKGETPAQQAAFDALVCLVLGIVTLCLHGKDPERDAARRGSRRLLVHRRSGGVDIGWWIDMVNRRRPWDFKASAPAPTKRFVLFRGH